MRYQRIRPLGSCGRRTDRRGRAGPRDRVPPGSFLPPPPDDPLPGEQVKRTLRMSLRGRFASLDRSATARELAAMRRTGRRGKPQVNDPICNRRGAMERDRGNGANLAHRDLSHLPRSLHLPEIACDGRDVRRGAHNPEVRIFTAAPKGQRPFPEQGKGPLACSLCTAACSRRALLVPPVSSAIAMEASEPPIAGGPILGTGCLQLPVPKMPRGHVSVISAAFDAELVLNFSRWTCPSRTGARRWR